MLRQGCSRICSCAARMQSRGCRNGVSAISFLCQCAYCRCHQKNSSIVRMRGSPGWWRHTSKHTAFPLFLSSGVGKEGFSAQAHLVGAQGEGRVVGRVPTLAHHHQRPEACGGDQHQVSPDLRLQPKPRALLAAATCVSLQPAPAMAAHQSSRLHKQGSHMYKMIEPRDSQAAMPCPTGVRETHLLLLSRRRHLPWRGPN